MSLSKIQNDSMQNAFQVTTFQLFRMTVYIVCVCFILHCSKLQIHVYMWWVYMIGIYVYGVYIQYRQLNKIKFCTTLTQLLTNQSVWERSGTETETSSIRHFLLILKKICVLTVEAEKLNWGLKRSRWCHRCELLRTKKNVRSLRHCSCSDKQRNWSWSWLLCVSQLLDLLQVPSVKGRALAWVQSGCSCQSPLHVSQLARVCLPSSNVCSAFKSRPPITQLRQRGGVIFTHRKAWNWRLPVPILSPGSFVTIGSVFPPRPSSAF